MSYPTTTDFIAGLIFFAREYCKISRAQFAGDLDISYQNLWDIEDGRHKVTGEYLDFIIEKLPLTPFEFWALVPRYIKYLKKLEAKTKTQKIN